MNNVEPYMFEPVYLSEACLSTAEVPDGSDDDETSVSDAKPATAGESRLTVLDWCEFGKRRLLETVWESTCCKEQEVIILKMKDGDICVTDTERCKWTCLDSGIIEIGLMAIHDSLRKGPLSNPVPNR